jgi:UDP-glucuronate 4-epimerase
LIIVTGVAGFIGFHLTRQLLDYGEAVVGIDSFDHAYDPALKAARAAELERRDHFSLVRLDVGDAEAVSTLFRQTAPRYVVHLAARAGVRHSLTDPLVYERANVAGHLSVLEACRGLRSLEHLVYASSSSVYGERSIERPFRESDPVDTPLSIYGATKRAAELMSATYTHLFSLPQTGLRFFSVYGPWGRPDMAYFEFTRRILRGEAIDVFGDGQMARDFTYVDDAVAGILAVLDCPPCECRHRLLNVASGRPVTLLAMVEALETALGKPALRVFLPRHPGDVSATYGDISAIAALAGYRPKVQLADGLGQFVEWFRDYYGTG